MICSGINVINFTALKSFTFFWLFFTSFFSITALAQKHDSIKNFLLSDIRIFESRYTFFKEDKNVIRYDSSVLKNCKNYSLSEFLATSSAIYIKSYGNGSIASISMRGTSANHTAVSWNGFPLNSLTTGDIDMSIVSIGNIDHITIINGASGSIYGNGTFGGAINLETLPDWNNRFHINIEPETGSYSTNKLSFSLRTGNQKIQFHSGITKCISVNNFEYTDIYQSEKPVLERTQNKYNSFFGYGNLYISFSSNQKLEAGFMYQTKYKEIPKLMGTMDNSNQIQRDSSLKTFLKWSYHTPKTSLHIKTAWFVENLTFTDKADSRDNIYTIDSKIKTYRWLNDISYRWFINDMFSIEFGALYNRLTADVKAYHNIITENNFAFLSATKFEYKRLICNFSLRKEINPNQSPKPLYSFGINYEIVKDYLSFRSNYSTQFRIPTFNDKYWKPGGNPDLKPEEGYTSDLGFDFRFLQKNKKEILKLSAGIYSSVIKNWIQWAPDGIYWNAQNLEKVWARGFESGASVIFDFSFLHLLLKANYTYSVSTRENDNPESFQLRYIPKHSAWFLTDIAYKSLSLRFDINYVSERETTDDNNALFRLKAYMISNLGISYKFHFKGYEFTPKIRINNLFDRQYETIRAFPMQGRCFYVALNCSLSK